MSAKMADTHLDAARPAVSVLILTYNQEGSIARAIESVLGQKTDFPFEIVIGEDGSADGTRAVCEQYARQHPQIITLLPSAPNKGIVRNYFDAFRAAKGTYISDCAGDDCWVDSSRMQMQKDFMDSHPDVAIHFGAWRNVDMGGLPVDYGLPMYAYQEGIADGRSVLERFITHRLPIVLSTALYRRKLLAEALEATPGMIENEAFGCEDLPVCAALLNSGSAACSPTVMLDYNVGNPDSITAATNRHRAFEFHFRALDCRLRLAQFYGVELKGMEPYLREQVRYMLSLAWQLRDRSLARRVANLVREHRLPHDLKSRLLMLLYR